MDSQEPVEREDDEAPPREALPFFLRVDFYLPLIVIGGIALATLLYLQGLLQLGWHDVPGSRPSVVGAFASPGAAEVVLYASPYTARYLHRAGGNHELILKQWRSFFAESKRPFREVADPKELSGIGSSVLIIPNGIALGKEECAAFLEHQRRGGALLASGPFGARDESGKWRGWQRMNELFGVQVAEEIPPSAKEKFLITFGDGVLTHRLPAGTRIWLGSASEPALGIAGGAAAGVLTDWSRTPNGRSPIIVFGDVAGARWALFGFSENAWEAQPTHFKTLVAGTLDWLQSRPSAYVAAWPNAYRAAQLTAMDIKGDVDRALLFSTMLDAFQMRGTFFVVSNAAKTAAPELNTLALRHEIAYGGDVHAGFEGQSVSEQRQRLEHMKTQLARVCPGGSAAGGFRAPAESYDETTEELLRRLGLRYHVADPNRADHRLPILAPEGKSELALVVLPRTRRDDANLLANPKITVQELTSSLKADLAASSEQGGLGVLALDSQNFGDNSLMHQAMPSYLVALAEQRKTVWLAAGTEIAQWWRQRDHLRTNLALHGTRQELELSYYGTDPILNPTVVVLHPYKSRLTLSATKAWIPRPTVRRLDDYRSAVVFDEVKKGHYAYQVVFEP